jgi:hypothetical protein
MSSSRLPSRQKASEQGLAIQQEVDSREAQKSLVFSQAHCHAAGIW